MLDRAVHLAPELAEILNGGGDAENHHAPHPEHRESAQGRPSDAQQHHANGSHLGDHLGLAQVAGLHDVTFRGGDAAQPRDGKFAADDQHHHPGRHSPDLHEGNQRRRNEQLIGNRIQQRPDCSDLLPTSREIAI
jgi:hypothetical protein